MIRYTLRQLEYLIACADAGSLVAAANALNVSQPSVSAAIAKLEEQLGVELLIRHHAQGVVPAAGARQFIEDARNLLDHAAEFQRGIDDSADEVSGTLNLGSFTSLAPTYLPGLIAAMGEQFPQVQLKFTDGTQRQLIDRLQQGELQLALVYDHELPENLLRIPLLDTTPNVLLPRGHKLAQKKKIRLSELVSEPLVLLDVSPSRGYFTGLFEKRGLEPRIAYRTGSIELVRGLVGRGLGYSILVTRPHGDMTYDGQPLVVRPIADKIETSRVVLCRRTSNRPSRLLLEFEQLAQQYFDKPDKQPRQH